MSQTIQIHRVESVTHTVRMHAGFCINELKITDEDGHVTTLDLFRPAGEPLELSAQPRVVDHGWAASENNPANQMVYPSEVTA